MSPREPKPASAVLFLRLEDIDVVRIEVDTEHNDNELGEDWCDLVVCAVGRNGEKVEVSRNAVRYDGMIGESAGAGRLVEVTSWLPLARAFSRAPAPVKIRCPKCHMEGHPGISCGRVDAEVVPLDADGHAVDLDDDPDPDDGGPVAH